MAKIIANPLRVDEPADVLRFVVANTLGALLASELLTLAICYALGGDVGGGSLVAAAVPLGLVPPIAARVARMSLRHSMATAELERLVRRDTMTEAFNRRGLSEIASITLAAGKPLTAIIVDIDHFKAINDRYGHEAGDAVVIGVAESLQGLADKYGGAVGRLGGDEFCVLLGDEPGLSMLEYCERIRVTIDGCAFDWFDEPLGVTVSIGAARSDANDRALADLLRRADAELYRSKSAGRNCVSVTRAA